jgi:hypothetical protein
VGQREAGQLMAQPLCGSSCWLSHSTDCFPYLEQ